MSGWLSMKTRSRWHLDVVEDDERVLLVEPHREWVVEEVRVGPGRAVAAEEDQPGRVHRDREAQRVLGRRSGRQRVAGIDRDLVGERRQRREDAAAPNDDAVLGVTDLVQRHRVALEHLVRGAVDGRVHECVRQREVFTGEPLLERDEVVVALCVAAIRAQPRGSLACEPRERDVHVVRRAPHEPDGGLRDAHQSVVTALQILLRPRDHVAHVDELAGLGVGHQAVVGILVLAIEHRCQLMRRTREGRVVDDVVDAFVAQPHLALGCLQTLEELLTRACAHVRRSARFAR